MLSVLGVFDSQNLKPGVYEPNRPIVAHIPLKKSTYQLSAALIHWGCLALAAGTHRAEAERGYY